jgi:hypothetical protein
MLSPHEYGKLEGRPVPQAASARQDMVAIAAAARGPVNNWRQVTELRIVLLNWIEQFV